MSSKNGITSNDQCFQVSDLIAKKRDGKVCPWDKAKTQVRFSRQHT